MIVFVCHQCRWLHRSRRFSSGNYPFCPCVIFCQLLCVLQDHICCAHSSAHYVSYTARQRAADTRFSPDNIIGLPIYEVYEQSKNTTWVEQNNSAVSWDMYCHVKNPFMQKSEFGQKCHLRRFVSTATICRFEGCL